MTRKGWTIAGLSAALLVAAPAARAHELECEKTVNGEVFLEADDFPLTLHYSLTVRNIHPSLPSEVLEASDPLLESLGFPGFDVPFTLPLDGEETKTFNVVLDDVEDCLKLAEDDGIEDDIIDNVFTVAWDDGSDVCTARVRCIPPETQSGPRMTGGGSVFGSGKDRVTHGFEIRCNPDDPRQNIEVNWPHANNFHLLDMTTATCIDDPALDEAPPVAGFDTYIGTGTGKLNGVDGATIQFTFTDDGEPGKNDTAHIVIRDPNGTVVLDVDGTLNFGNHQAHKATP